MKEIDWSKAPEGATHWDSRGNCCSVGFMKPGRRIGEWEYFGIGGHWVLYGPVDGALKAAMVKRPADTPWTGEGLPPVGEIIEWLDGEFLKAVVVGHHQGAVVAVDDDDPRRVFIGKKPCYRPLRTPEQIAAEEREKAIEEMARIGTMAATPKSMAAKLYDAGCRMVTP